VEYIPIRDYYHRHTRSIFWEIQDIVTFGNHPVFRWLCGWLMPPHISVLKRTQTEEIRRLYELHHVVQDMLVPASQLEATLLQSKAEFDVFPLWICPMRIFPEDTGFVSPSSKGEEMYVDVGIYGVPKVSPPPHKIPHTHLLVLAACQAAKSPPINSSNKYLLTPTCQRIQPPSPSFPPRSSAPPIY